MGYANTPTPLEGQWRLQEYSTVILEQFPLDDCPRRRTRPSPILCPLPQRHETKASGKYNWVSNAPPFRVAGETDMKETVCWSFREMLAVSSE